jgi:LuxR family transcriptional regulator, maltose regulon positive regulatory protein
VDAPSLMRWPQRRIARKSHALRQNCAMPTPDASPLDAPTAFALAKIQPPHPRSALIERPALELALGQALQQQKLTLLLAPAGSGKTAALTRQIRQLPAGCALAWVSADADDPLQRFLACLTAALEPYDLPWRVAPDALATLAQAEQGMGRVVSEVVNALAAAEVPRGLIVIDDAHRSNCCTSCSIAGPNNGGWSSPAVSSPPCRWPACAPLGSWPNLASASCVSVRPR